MPYHVRVAASIIADGAFDRRHGTQTSGVVELDALEIDGENKERGVRYEPTRARPLERLLRDTAPPTDGGFVDFGCGMGRVMIVASEYGFPRVTGVDFSEALCRKARANTAVYQTRTRCQTEFVVRHADAVDYAIRDDDTTFYFFNPFDEAVLLRVLENIVSSLARAPREVRILYHNPIWRGAIDRLGVFDVTADRRYSDCRFVVFQSRADLSLT